ncbi:MAG: glycosyltransferase [Bacillota bacterium]
MKVLFCHDGPLRKDEDMNYYGSAHTDSTFKRYYSIGNELNVLIRVSKIKRTEAEERLSKITVKPFKVIECPNISNLKGILTSYNKFNQTIQTEVEKADYIVARLPSRIGFTAIDYAKKYNKPYLVELVTCPWDAYWNHSIPGKVLAPFMYKKTKNRVDSAPYVVYVTNNFLQHRYPATGQQINCSNVALKDFNEGILVNRINKIKSRKEDEPLIIGTVGAVNVKFKGQQYIIAALGELKKKGISSFEYHLVGGGDQHYLKKIAEKNNVSDQVKFLGAMPNGEVYEFLKSIDIYSQPSRQEGLPRALIEAMSQGLPSFGAKTAGIPELLENEFIFSNSRKNVSEIIHILRSFSKEKMQSQANRNYQESQKYKKEIIEDKRNRFFYDFKISNIGEESLK